MNTCRVATIKPRNTRVLDRNAPGLRGHRRLVVPDVDVRGIFDHVRMPDAETCPCAYPECGFSRIELTNAHLKGNIITGRFQIRPRGKADS